MFSGTEGGARKCGGREVNGVGGHAVQAIVRRAAREADRMGVTSGHRCLLEFVVAVV